MPNCTISLLHNCIIKFKYKTIKINKRHSLRKINENKVCKNVMYCIYYIYIYVYQVSQIYKREKNVIIINKRANSNL